MAVKKPKLLIVDDEPDMLDFLERVLRRRFDVSRCSNADEALERLASDEFEVLLTDQKMPRVSGLELLERVGDRHPNLVRVLISGFTGVPEIQRAIERCRMHNYILKPVDSDSVLAGIDKAYRVRDGEPFGDI